MKLEYKFTVLAPIDTVWRALLDPERVTPCFPGATITSAGGDEFAGIVKARLGPISLQYRGLGRFTETDEAVHRTVIEATGTAPGGHGTVAAKVQASLAENGEGTAVTVVTDLTVTGKPAQFGRGLIEDVGGKIIGQFADCLSRSLGPTEGPAPAAESPPSAPSQPTSSQPASSQPAPVRPVPPPVTEEIDLLDAAGRAVAKRAVPAIIALILLALVIRWRRSGNRMQ
ncbi:MAG TPA: SRPBCC family protein [Pseudonocardiaceae bacterium]|jgi:carbon monoxide dehydrogenase subunit G|nr:SRPBCC family protein [Pseudonocardiaceae bacterium]